MSNLNAVIKTSSKNIFAVKAAVQTVSVQHPWAVQVMGGVAALSNVILAVITAGTYTVGQAASKVEQALQKTMPVVIQMMNQTLGLGGCGTVLQKILKQLA